MDGTSQLRVFFYADSKIQIALRNILEDLFAENRASIVKKILVQERFQPLKPSLPFAQPDLFVGLCMK